jgi:hypothetical protein
MSENSKLNYRELLKKTAVTYDQTVERVESEKQRPQVDRFRMGDDGTYNVRILPLAPYLTPDGELDESKELRPSFEYPLRQMFIDIKGAPKKEGGKPSIISIPVIQATQKGVDKSVDIIDTYRKLVRELYAGDKAIVDLMDKTRFEKGLRWDSQRVMYVINLDEKKNPILLWQASAAQYHDFVGRQVKLWNKLKANDEDADDPLASFEASYALEITRTTEKKKTSYSFNIDMTNSYKLTDEDMEALFNKPRIPEVIYRLTRYQVEATILFLQQFDEEHDLDIMEEDEMKEAIERLKGELDPNDQSHFDLASAGEKGEGNGGKLTIENLNDRYDALLDKGLADDSDEGTDLREDIRAFVEDNDLDVKLKHSMTTEQMLDLIEDALEEASKSKAKKADDDEDEKETKKAKKEAAKDDDEDETPRRKRAKVEDDDEPEKEEKKADDDDEQPTRRRRGARPSAEDDDEPEKKEEEPEKKDDDEEPVEGRRRRRNR